MKHPTEDQRIMAGLIPRRFIIHIIVLSIWTAALGYAALTGQIRSPVTVSSSASIHFTSANTQCDPSITCSVSDIFQISCTITSGLSVICGNTSIQTGEKYDIVANVTGGVPSSSHTWQAASSNGIVTPTPATNTLSLDSTGNGSFKVVVQGSLTLTGADVVTVNIT